MKKTSYIGKKQEDLIKSLSDKRSSLRDARFGTAGSKIRNVKEIRNMKKDVARILTELNKK